MRKQQDLNILIAEQPAPLLFNPPNTLLNLDFCRNFEISPVESCFSEQILLQKE